VYSSFRDLDAYRRAAAAADRIWRLVATWPEFARWSGRDQRRFLIMARSSLLESEHWLTCAAERGLIEPDAALELRPIAQALSGLINKRSR